MNTSEPTVDEVPLSERSYGAATRDDSVFVRVAVAGHIVGVQLEPAAMQRPADELAARIMACADVAAIRGQVELRKQWEIAGEWDVAVQAFPSDEELAAAERRLQEL
ncbi:MULTISPECIES: DUF2694 family protein [Mycolicibacterium]|uniref:DUF2694 family protein n=1 Tax=Mycolicibacterium TaxID=1866885 RepID=UPI001E328653|nr:DUF2694 family protein [Mycolicibacterium mageritense]MCC9184338.1 DUF2694 domain-containing protein [Mycolicibacterium mageritense]